jgi:hypothetical protein
MQEVAEYESDRTGEHVTVSDLVRQACVNLLLMHETMRVLYELPDLLDPELDEESWEEELDFGTAEGLEEIEENDYFEPVQVVKARL